MPQNPSLFISCFAVAVSLLSAVYAYRESKEASNMRKIVQADKAEQLIEMFEDFVALVKVHYSRSELVEQSQQFEKRVRQSEVTLGVKMYRIAEDLIDPMLDAVDERISFLESGGGADREAALAEKVDAFEMKVQQASQLLRKRLRVSV